MEGLSAYLEVAVNYEQAQNHKSDQLEENVRMTARKVLTSFLENKFDKICTGWIHEPTKKLFLILNKSSIGLENGCANLLKK